MTKRVGIIGFGNIGKRLYERLVKKGWDIAFVADSKYIHDFIHARESIENWRNYCDNINLAFLAIPTLDDGLIAVNYITYLRGRNIPVVTCEKGALSNYFDGLRLLLSGIGHSATVGGGLGMIHILQHRFFSGTQEVYAILNGTLNYIFCDYAMGNPLGHIIEEVQKLGYAEPGESDPIKIIAGEACFDATKKASILFNTCFKSDVFLRAKDITTNLSERMIRSALSQAKNMRFVVSFRRAGGFRQGIAGIPVFQHEIGGWIIEGGFMEMNNPLIARLCNATTWVNNGVLTVEGDNGSDGVFHAVCPGAGPGPTTAAMIRDAERLLNIS